MFTSDDDRRVIQWTRLIWMGTIVFTFFQNGKPLSGRRKVLIVMHTNVCGKKIEFRCITNSN
jgi:hypothetical protein